MGKFKSKIKRYSKLIVILVLGFMGLSLLKNINQIKSAQEKISEARTRVENLQTENKDLKREIEKSRSEKFIEEQLRDSLGYAKEGEVVVVLPDDEFLRRIAPENRESDQQLPQPNWKKWVSLFLSD